MSCYPIPFSIIPLIKVIYMSMKSKLCWISPLNLQPPSSTSTGRTSTPPPSERGQVETTWPIHRSSSWRRRTSSRPSNAYCIHAAFSIRPRPRHSFASWSPVRCPSGRRCRQYFGRKNWILRHRYTTRWNSFHTPRFDIWVYGLFHHKSTYWLVFMIRYFINDWCGSPGLKSTEWVYSQGL